MKKIIIFFGVLALAACSEALDPDCTPEKAAKNAVSKSTIGVGVNRCSPAETVNDTLGIDDKKDAASDRADEAMGGIDDAFNKANDAKNIADDTRDLFN